MILCVSANPAIDKRMQLKTLVPGTVNRVGSLWASPGGKAAHVAMAAAALGEATTWIGFLGGSSGKEHRESLKNLGINVVAVTTSSETRTNLEIIEAEGRVTELLEPGGKVTTDEVAELIRKFQVIAGEYGPAVQVAMSGSLPPGAPPDLWSVLLEICQQAGCKTYLDTSGDALRHGIGARPDVVKPNRQEAEWLLGDAILDLRGAALAAHRLMAEGARGVALSLGPEGLLWLAKDEEKAILAVPPSIPVHSTVGCGDCALAGILVAERRGLSPSDLVSFAAACGTANCSAALPARISQQEVKRIWASVVTRVLE